MHVGLMIYGSIETLTGGYLYDRKFVEFLASQGDRAGVISLPRPERLSGALADNARPSLMRRVAGAPFDVLVQDELIHPSTVLLNRRLTSRARCPIVTIVHLLRSSERAVRLRRLSSAAERRYLAGVDGAVFNSETTRAAVESLLGRRLPGVVAYPGCDHLAADASESEIAARARADGALRVLSVANVLPGKGLHVLVDALAHLPAGGWRLAVVGSLTMDRAYAGHLRGLIERAGLRNNVDLVGAVPNSRVADYLRDSHLLVVPSDYEALGIAYLEAMRFGLPVIATAAGGAGEIIGHGTEGFLVAPGDAAAITAHLRLLGEDREVLFRMGLAAQRRVARHPTWRESFEPVRRFLASLAETHRGQRSRETTP